MGQIITFYSYKGGTGRTMTLANIGHILAWQLTPRRNVLMIDWDLEAPGLHRYFFDELKANFTVSDERAYTNALNGQKGLIEFFEGVQKFYRDRYPSSDDLSVMHAETEKAASAFADALKACPLRRFVLDVTAPDDIRRKDTPSGRLSLMKAGDQSTQGYINSIRSFDWESFYNDYGSFFTHFREYLMREYDVVLIDSRTGLTDLGDICTRVMPEKLVGVFVPNEQNIEGLTGVMQGAAEHRLNSRDPRPLVVYPLASRNDFGRSRLQNVWWKGGNFRDHMIVGYERRFENLIRPLYGIEKPDLHNFFNLTQLPHDADYAFGEELAARDNVTGDQTIASRCTNLAAYLMDDRPPWEETSVTTPEAISESLQPQLGRAAPPTARALLLTGFRLPFLLFALAIYGVAFAYFGQMSQDLFFTKPGSTTLGDVKVQISTTDITAWGIGTATLTVSKTTAGNAGAETIQFSVDRGIVSPTSIPLPASSDALIPDFTATLTSGTSGPAHLSITLIGEKGQKTQASVPLSYRWPIVIAFAAFGGYLSGLAFHSIRQPITPYRDPSVIFTLVEAAQSAIVSIILIVFYLEWFSSLIDPDYRYSATLIFLIAASGPLLFQSFLKQTVQRLGEGPRVPPAA